jgi:hypothetical protein
VKGVLRSLVFTLIVALASAGQPALAAGPNIVDDVGGIDRVAVVNGANLVNDVSNAPMNGVDTNQAGGLVEARFWSTINASCPYQCQATISGESHMYWWGQNLADLVELTDIIHENGLSVSVTTSGGGLQGSGDTVSMTTSASNTWVQTHYFDVTFASAGYWSWDEHAKGRVGVGTTTYYPDAYGVYNCGC